MMHRYSLLPFLGVAAIACTPNGPHGERPPTDYASDTEPSVVLRRRGNDLLFTVRNPTDDRLAISDYPGHSDAFFRDRDGHDRYLTLNIDAAEMRPMGVDEVILLPPRSEITYTLRVDEYQVKDVPPNAKIWARVTPFSATIWDMEKDKAIAYGWMQPYLLKKKLVSPEIPF